MLCYKSIAILVGTIVICTINVNCEKYFVPSTQKSWQNARKECKKANADLVTIDNAAEQSRLGAFLRDKGIHTRNHWIGLNDIQSEGRWRWISGPTSKLFTNWHPGEPNNSGDEDCAVMYPSRYSFKWNDAGCSTVYNFICEKAKPKPTFSVFCNTDHFGIVVEKNKTRSLESVTLKDPSCTGTSNATHITLSTTFSECGTRKSETSDYIIISNELRMIANPNSGVITRENKTITPFECKYSKSGLEASLKSFQPKVVSAVKAKEESFGNFTIQLRMARGASFNSYIYNYPVAVNINDRIYFQLSLNASGADAVLLIEKCYATPSSNRNDALKYVLIENRCPVDSTVQFHSGGIQQKRFSFLAFNFLQRVSTIYMHCESYICHKASQNSRCTSGCGINKVSRRKRDLEKREIQDEPSKLYVVDNGPIQKSPQKFETHSSSTLKTTLTVVAIAASVFGLMLVGIFILKLRKRMMKKSTMKAITFQRKEGVDNKAAEIEASA